MDPYQQLRLEVEEKRQELMIAKGKVEQLERYVQYLHDKLSAMENDRTIYC